MRNKYVKNACNHCRNKKNKCNGKNPCELCIKHKIKCIYTPHKKRGPKPKTSIFTRIKNLLN
jgi:hypothetical protein